MFLELCLKVFFICGYSQLLLMQISGNKILDLSSGVKT